MAVHRQRALPLSVDAQDAQLPAVTRHVGGARGVHTQTLRGGAALRAAVSDVIVFFREENREREKVMVLINHFHKRYTVCTLYTLVYWKNYIWTFFLTSICRLCIFHVALWMVKG